VATVTVLEREMYEVGEAARLLGVHSRTLRNWLDGYTARGKPYRPVLRERPTGSDLLTWGEFVEAGFLNEYRRIQRVPLPEIRTYIDTWREKLQVPYPLAHQQPYAGPGRHRMDVAETREGDTVIYRFHDGQLILTPWAQEFVRKVDFDHSIASRYWPAGRDQQVVIDPQRSFGAPTVEGIRTEVLYEMFAAGDPIDEIADGYDLDRSRVEAAVRYESSRPHYDTASFSAA
jgi:uncharacterized protein (DUF433 family)